MRTQPSVPCKWCGTRTVNTGTLMCDRCWEMDRRVCVSHIPLFNKMWAEVGYRIVPLAKETDA